VTENLESLKCEKLANSLLDIISEVGREKVPPGMIGFVGELLVLSRMYTIKEIASEINYLGGRKPCDIEIVHGKTPVKILVKTNLYGRIEKEDFGVNKGFLWSDLRVEKLSGNQGKPKPICFHFVVLVGVRQDRQPKFYVLTKDEFMKATDNKFGKSGWRQAKGTRVIALVEKKNEAIFDKLSEKKKGYVSNFSTNNSETFVGG
jgi:hypothetical protein